MLLQTSKTLFARIYFFAFVSIMAACSNAPASELSAGPEGAEVFAPGNKAINGYDPVAFFVESRPVKGNDQFTYDWKNVTWSFSDQEHLNLFKAAPEKYAPQYGGYCAYGTAQGHKAPTEPGTWTILDGKLYFNYSDDVKREWSKNREAFILKADTNWPTVKLQK
jgi:YHS domain-containing protein